MGVVWTPWSNGNNERILWGGNVSIGFSTSQMPKNLVKSLVFDSWFGKHHTHISSSQYSLIASYNNVALTLHLFWLMRQLFIETRRKFSIREYMWWITYFNESRVNCRNQFPHMAKKEQPDNANWDPRQSQLFFGLTGAAMTSRGCSWWGSILASS